MNNKLRRWSEIEARQKRILELIAQGLPQYIVAERLGLSRQLIGQTVARAKKLQANAEAAQ